MVSEQVLPDHFLALDPTDLTVDLLEQHLLADEISVVAVGAARGTPRTPFFEGCSPSPLAPSYASAAAGDVLGAEDVGAASALSGKRRNSKGKDGKSGGGGSGGGGGGGGSVGGGGGGGGGSGGGSGGFGGGGGGSGGGGGRGSSGSGGSQVGATCGKPHSQHRCFSRLDDAWRAKFGDEAECPCWDELLRSGVDIFALDYDAILAAMYALSVSTEGDCYLCVPPDPGIETTALGSSESAIRGTAHAEALHTFTLDSSASHCFFRDSLHLPSFSTNLVSTAAILDAMVTTTTPGGQRVMICPVAAPCSCRLLTHQTLLWHHRLGHPSLPRPRGMHSRLLVSGLPRSLPPLPPSPALPCLPCVEGQQRAAPHYSSFPPTNAPLQTLHMDRFRADLLVLRLQSDRGGEFSFNLLRDFWHGESILQSFTLATSTQQNGIAERRIGLVMEVARTSLIHAAAPHFLRPFAVRYAAHQLNLWPRVSLPENSPTLHWTWKVGDASVFRVLQRFGFRYSLPQPTPLPTSHSLSAPPSDESVEPSGPYPKLVGCLMYLMTCTRPDLAYPLSILARYIVPRRHRPEHWEAAKRVLCYLCSTSGMGLVLGGQARVVLTGHADASWVDDSATQRSSQGYTFSLGSGSVSWPSTRSSSVLSSSCEAEIYAGAMAAQELRWLTYLLADLGERPRSSPVLYVDNKAMIALCQEHRLEHRTKHIALHYFLAQELQQRGQLRLAYMATRANTADIFTKALPPGDHQRFCTVLGLVPTLPHLLTS
ncbi:unnamed protein product [Closterium sp. NIES-54]